MATMPITPRMRWAGLAAFFGGLTAMVMTLPFATAYFLAYPGEDALPFWFNSVEPRLDTLLTFSSRSSRLRARRIRRSRASRTPRRT